MKDEKLLPPPWIAFPNIERYSIGWRMGVGEDYICKWADWFESLAPNEVNQYQNLFPEPTTWKGYWDDQDECSYFENQDFLIELWQDKGTPKYSLKQLQKDYSAGKKIKFNMFWGHQPAPNGQITKSCFSQWWKSDFWSIAHTYCCMEQFMMVQKAELFNDKDILQQILSCNDPKQIKALGRKVKHFDEQIWNDVKYSIVLNGNYKKFSQNAELKKFLLATGNTILVEASPYDAIWGIKMYENDKDSQNPLKWRGQNLLGFALMEVRDELKRVYQNEALCNMNAID